jgi:hypothetical protein
VPRVVLPSPPSPQSSDAQSEPSALNFGANSSSLRRIFAPDGLLARALPQSGRDWEDRAEQREWRRPWRVPSTKSITCWSKPHWHGKSYAYLVPLILWAVAKQREILVATPH